MLSRYQYYKDDSEIGHVVRSLARDVYSLLFGETIWEEVRTEKRSEVEVVEVNQEAKVEVIPCSDREESEWDSDEVEEFVDPYMYEDEEYEEEDMSMAVVPRTTDQQVDLLDLCMPKSQQIVLVQRSVVVNESVGNPFVTPNRDNNRTVKMIAPKPTLSTQKPANKSNVKTFDELMLLAPKKTAGKKQKSQSERLMTMEEMVHNMQDGTVENVHKLEVIEKKNIDLEVINSVPLVEDMPCESEFFFDESRLSKTQMMARNFEKTAKNSTKSSHVSSRIDDDVILVTGLRPKNLGPSRKNE